MIIVVLPIALIAFQFLLRYHPPPPPLFLVSTYQNHSGLWSLSGLLKDLLSYISFLNLYQQNRTLICNPYRNHGFHFGIKLSNVIKNSVFYASPNSC